jgi:hypothetical protein
MRVRFILASRLVAIGVRLADSWLRGFLIVIGSPRSRGPVGWGTLREYNLPTVPRCCGRADDVRHLGSVHALIGVTDGLGKFVRQRPPGCRTGSLFENPCVGFTRVCERFALPVLDIEEPNLCSSLAKAQRAALTVVEHMGSFMDDKVSEAILFMEVLRGNVACSVLAEADKVGSILTQQFRT